MVYRARLKQLLLVTSVIWLLTVGAIGTVTFGQINIMLWLSIMAGLGGVSLLALMTLNHSQLEVAESRKNHSLTKRQMQEQRLKLERLEFNAKKARELRQIVLNSTTEKDQSLRNMADALKRAMDEVVELTSSITTDSDTLNKINGCIDSVQSYALDLQSLAKLELKAELPKKLEIDFIDELNRLVEQWAELGKSRKVRIVLENPEEQIRLNSDLLWIENILTRIVQALVKMNQQTALHIHFIGYLDAERGDVLRVRLAIKGRQLSADQLKHVLTDHLSITENGQEIGPGLSLVVAGRMAQLLNGSLSVSNSEQGMELIVVLPCNSVVAEEPEESYFM